MTLQRLNMNDLVALQALLVERHVTRAAARSGISQSAMSHTLRRLRDTLGDPLLVKSREGMVLTPRAAQLASAVGKALADLERALFDEPSFDPATSTRSFTIACVDLIVIPLLMSLLPMLEREGPGLRLAVKPLRADRFLDELARDELDLAIVGPEPTGDYSRSLLYTEDAVCVVRRDHPVLKKPWTKEAFRSLRHLAIQPHSEDVHTFRELFAKHGVAIDVVLTVPYFTAGPILVAMSDLALVCPRRLAVSMAVDFPIQLLPVPFAMEGGGGIYQVWHPRRDGDPALRWLRESIDRSIAESIHQFDAGPLREHLRRPAKRPRRR